MSEEQAQMQYPKSLCEKCVEVGEVIGIGSATGRPYYRCPKCGAQWPGKSPAAQALGSMGGKARAEALTPEERSKQAKQAGEIRWGKNRA